MVVDKFSSRSDNNKASSQTEKPGSVSTMARVPDPRNSPTIDQDALQEDLELLAKLRQQIEQLPDMDASKIVRLHERIMRGEYHVDSERLASKLSDFESEL